MRSALTFEPEYFDPAIIDDRIQRLKLETKDHGGQPATVATFKFWAAHDDQDALIQLEDIAFALAGFIGLVFEEEVDLDSIALVDISTRKALQQQEGRWLKTFRPASSLAGTSVFNAAERRALYWIGKGQGMVRPDDRLSCLYAAAEALISSDMKREGAVEKCHECDRPYATAPMKMFLERECGVNLDKIKVILDARSEVVHGKRSAVTHYSRFIHASDDLLVGLRAWFGARHSVPYSPPVIQVGGKFMMSLNVDPDEDLNQY